MRIGLVLAIVLACHGVAAAGPSTGTRGVEVTSSFGLMIGAQDVGPHDGFTAPTLLLDLGVTLPGGVRISGELATGLWTREHQGSDMKNLPPSSGGYRRLGATLRVPLMRLGVDKDHGYGRRRIGTMWTYAEVGLGRHVIDAPDGHPMMRGGPGDSPLLDAFTIARSDLLIGFGMAPTVGLGKKRTLFGAFYSVRAILSGGAEPTSPVARSTCKGLCPTEPSRQVDVGLYLTLGLLFGR